jgi:hypothetical protein
MHRCCWAFGFCHRHDRFGPGNTGGRGFTPLARLPGQTLLDVLPHNVTCVSIGQTYDPNCSAEPIGRSLSNGSTYPSQTAG